MQRSSTPRKNPSKRPLGLYRGQIWMADNFNAPLELVEASGVMGSVSERSSETKKKGKACKSRKKSSR